MQIWDVYWILQQKNKKIVYVSVLPSLQKAASKLFNKDVNKYLKTWKELKAHKRLKVR